MTKRHWSTSISAAALCLGLTATAAAAQQASSPTAPAPAPAPPSDGKTTLAPKAESADLSEVVVTARRSSEKLQDVPLSINAVTSDQLLERQITDLQSLAKYVPGFSFRDFVTSFHGNPTIRGSSQINTASAITNVGVFVDGVYLQRDYQLNQSLGDFDRIEVVKGPQSALYGANTFAGAVNYVTKRPTDEFAANGEATIGDAGYRRFEAGVGGPIVKGILDGRVYVGSDKYDGTITNNTPGLTSDDKTFGGHDRTAYSVALRFTPTNYLTFDASYLHTEKTEEIRPFYTVSGSFREDVTNCGLTVATTGRGGLFCGTFGTNPAAYRSGVGSPPPGLFSNIQPTALGKNDVIRFSGDWVINPSFSAHYVFGSTRGSESEDYSFFSNNYNPSLNAGPTAFTQQIEGGQIHYTSHELRLDYEGGPIKAEIGYFHSDAYDRYFLGFRLVPITGGVIPPFTRSSTSPLYVAPGTIALNNLEQRFGVDAIFGRASYNFLDGRATLAAELRYSMTDITFNDINARIAVPSRSLLKSSYDDPTPRFTAEYKLTRDNLIYASAAEGIKTGGFNGYVSGTITLLPAEQGFGEEKNWTYELGSKNAFLEHRLFFNADFFYIDWSKKLGSVAPSNSPPTDPLLLSTVANIYEPIGASTNYGFEIDGQYKPIRPLTLGLSFAAIRATYNNGSKNLAFVGYCSANTCPVNGDISGNTLERAPALSGAVTTEYRDHAFRDLDYFIGGDVTYQSMQYTDQEDLGKIPSTILVNARIGFENERWKAFLFVKNLTDQLYVDSVFYVQSQRQYSASFGERRTFGVTLAGKF